MTSSLRTQLISEAAQSVSLLAKAVLADGDAVYSEALFRQAADLELASAELQACWGGAFNGQSGRQAIVQELLGRIMPAAVIETGTFRGISTEWLAQRYFGPIFTCEKERLYRLQAEKRLQGIGNITQKMQDSREFLRDIVGTLPTDQPILFYLDAHWELDLPLKEELRIIFDAPCRSVVLIDDFKVPDDAGYSWDDYGPGKSLEVALVAEVLAPDTRVYFPALPSTQETSVRRGCCVIVRDPAIDLGACALLRGNSLAEWLKVDTASGAATRAADDASEEDEVGASQVSATKFKRLEQQLQVAEADRMARLRLINDLSVQLQASEADRAARLNLINDLSAQNGGLRSRLNEIEHHADQRLRDVHKLTAEIDKFRSVAGDNAFKFGKNAK